MVGLCLCLTQLQRQVFDCFDMMLQFTLIDVEGNRIGYSKSEGRKLVQQSQSLESGWAV